MLEESKSQIDLLLKFDNTLIRMFLTDFKILKRWTVKRERNNYTRKYEEVFVHETDLE